MSLLAEYRETETLVKELEEKLKKLASDQRLQTDLEFLNKLKDLMGEYGKSLNDVIRIIDPKKSNSESADAKKISRPRETKVFKNPHTGEVIQTKGANHKTLKAWKAEYGNDVVTGWLQE